MYDISLFAVTFALSGTTKWILAGVAVAGFVGYRMWQGKSPADTPGPVAPPVPTDVAGPDAPVDVGPSDHFCQWLDHWRHLMESALEDGDVRQVELLNLMISAKTEDRVCDECECEDCDGVCQDDPPEQA